MLFRDVSFKSATPIWEEGTSGEMNRSLRFEASFFGSSARLRIAGCTHFQVFVNGALVFWGPARAAKGYFRVSELCLNGNEGERNEVCVLITSDYCIQFEFMKQPPFLCAEIEQDGSVVAATGKRGWSCFSVPERVQKVQRFSVQRAFCEVYRMDRASERREVVCTPAGEKHFIAADTLFPVYEYTPCTRFLACGTVEHSPAREHYGDRAITKIGTDWDGFRTDELEICSTFEVEDLKLTATGEVPSLPLRLQNQYATVAFDHNRAGFFRLNVTCTEKTRLYLTFDEILTDGKVNFKRLQCSAVVLYILEAGKSYQLLTAHPYTAQYLNLISFGGAVTVESVGMVNLRCSEEIFQKELDPLADEEIRSVYNAGKETFCQNALDLLNSDPSRERAVWLCDTYFIGRVERLMTGKATLETVTLANFAMAKHPDRLPEGMLPMCYPSDTQLDGRFIPTWAMWYFLEVTEYVRFTGDRTFLSEIREQMYALYRFFQQYETESGLLADLPSWVFVEWSHCNKCTKGINYPCNMLYYRFLKELSDAYGDSEISRRADGLRALIRQRGRDGMFFYDHSLQNNDGQWELQKADLTETCQYYAFYMGVATAGEDPELWETIVRDFGPDRAKTGLWKEIYPSNALMGFYMRFDLLCDAGETERLDREIRLYFRDMATLTGTVWEHNKPSASCSHAFASHVLVWLDRLHYLKPKS